MCFIQCIYRDWCLLCIMTKRVNGSFLTFVFLAFIFPAGGIKKINERVDCAPHHFWCGWLQNAHVLCPNFHCYCWFVYPVRMLWCIKEIDLLQVVVFFHWAAIQLCRPGACLHSAVPRHRPAGPQGTSVLYSQLDTHTVVASQWCQSSILNMRFSAGLLVCFFACFSALNHLPGSRQRAEEI